MDATLDVVGGKWNSAILCLLKERESLRTKEIEEAFPTLSRKVLSQCLKSLENKGVIHRKIETGATVKVTYRLSKYGRSLEEVLDTLCTWGQNHMNKE
ncbi:HxlR family transcriptional regulator [Pontibacillus halophilus JSM 076056 = DSM 19796]|uniref:HxlR family transcriptional regulator n=1 Tax=Pontibacillus halophilus JSM 076056 = DSM 19796 TaxID=1385510 RepID=A0A0A5I808_9BACI|nr:HxlR family transcriptional regulator [Pontibacillus halophilus JSM 076056 = DSM 19796]